MGAVDRIAVFTHCWLPKESKLVSTIVVNHLLHNTILYLLCPRAATILLE